MNDTERVIGALEEFKRSSEKRADSFEAKTDERFDKIEEKLESLNNFKIKVTAYAILAVIVAKVLAESVISVLAKS